MSTVFTTDWARSFRKNAAGLLREMRGEPLDYLEIGVFEGRSARWMFENILTHTQATCTGIDAYNFQKFDVETVQNNMTNNLAAYADRFRLIIADAVDALIQLRQERARFDIVYVDGNHTGIGTAIDLILSWHLLEDGGILALDDMKHPKYLGLRKTVGAIVPQLDCDVLCQNYQWWLRKKSDRYLA